MLYWVLKWIIIGPWLRILWRPKVEGLDNIPPTGPAILASNHVAFIDSVFLPLMVHRPIRFMAKSEYFTGKGLKGWLSRVFFTTIGCVPVDRKGGRAARAALDAGKKVLDEGRLWGMYPEGTRSPDGQLYRGKTGVARLALESGVPVIPCAMVNFHEVQPPGHKLPRIKRVHMRIGEPLDFSRYAGMAGDRFVERSVTDEIMYNLMNLSGQEYVDVYATKVKNAPPPTPTATTAA
ncbi:MAG TPA: lysophospholipid acyltransferase family protein [Actinocatenispora sp.]